MMVDEVAARNRLEQVARQVIGDLIRKPGFGFLEAGEFIHQAVPLVLADQECQQAARVGADPTQVVERRIKYHYNTVLYTSSLAGGSGAQNRAYQELSRYLYRNAYHYLGRLGCPAELAPTLAEDGAQAALLRIHKYVVGKLNKPSLFLYFAYQNLKNECLRIQKEAHKSGSWQKYGQSEEEEGAGLDNLPAPCLADTADLVDCLMAAIQRLPNKDWQTAQILKYFSGWGDDEIASQVLHTSKGNVQAMHTRARAALRADQALRKCLEP